jgi:3-oxoacyl-[acyl-carrier protein] reductase
MSALAGKVAVVTGASRGIGRAIAVSLARAGCAVAVNYHERAESAAETARLVEAEGAVCCVVRADVSIPDKVRRLFDEVSAALGPASIVVNNAGVARPRPIDQLTLMDFDEAISVNLRSAFLVTQAFLPAMRAARWGRLIYLSSVAAQVGGVVGPHYAASKAGMHGLAHAYAIQLAKEGITANVIAPALIETEMVTNNPRARADIMPVGRFGTVEEVADVVLSVIANGFITGQTVNVNGGWYFT